MNEYKKQVISENIKARHEEIAGYEINIFNYEYMIPKVTDAEYRSQLQSAVESNYREVDKVKLVLEALEEQLKSL